MQNSYDNLQIISKILLSPSNLSGLYPTVIIIFVICKYFLQNLCIDWSCMIC